MVMSAAFEVLAGRLAQSFTALSRRIDEQVLTQRICGGDTYCACRFVLEAGTLRDVVRTFRDDQRLWTDFLSAVRAHRPERHWETLVEFVYEIGNLQGQLWVLGRRLRCPCPQERKRLARRLNELDGEIAVRHVLADRRNLADRVCTAASIPLIDGLTMRGLTFVLAEDGELLSAWASLVDGVQPTQGEWTRSWDW
jgi:hypothetical protein